jgi:hypothetical protein
MSFLEGLCLGGVKDSGTGRYCYNMIFQLLSHVSHVQSTLFTYLCRTNCGFSLDESYWLGQPTEATPP